MLGKLLGKKSGYYLELSEDEIAAIPEPPVKPAPKAPAAKSEPAAAATSATPAGAAATDEPAAAKPATATVPTEATAGKASAAMPQEVAIPEPMSDPLELIRTALAASANQTPEAEPKSVPTFADYSAPLAKARRRRPGPSMSPFKSMAKDMRKTSSGF